MVEFISKKLIVRWKLGFLNTNVVYDLIFTVAEHYQQIDHQLLFSNTTFVARYPLFYSRKIRDSIKLSRFAECEPILSIESHFNFRRSVFSPQASFRS